ncbi:hypothetical protein H5410_002426 [Solanum commersonii]|uniref:Uncharacterized protein n=1 Tax=Solanum commersonii TaxID=4109 RepID=A0A9J6B1Q9_SOLCO|nr:hypothetical protein H5410_002426 [Solanum commersonii]
MKLRMMGSKLSMHTFPVHFQPSAIGDRIISCFGQYLDWPMNNNVRFQISMVYELLKRRLIF